VAAIGPFYASQPDANGYLTELDTLNRRGYNIHQYAAHPIPNEFSGPAPELDPDYTGHEPYCGASR